ncbi:hypothetical protein P4H27_16720 [Paenibacillus taichungensis]|uniref:hypothetical protein n=1 Tax=Paenibacillus taichungensis TaxID=484184 RepID=UPI002DB7F5B9|nr:hypothetical protein [Paenibacillus taichungensis]MEC0108604.1 hypothetical protein [Paenibacillus taichungensis]MEC0196104.1 hypothetical protein [Paenibacillus taichungensis]
MSNPKKASLFAMLIMILLVAAACGDKADNNAKSKESTATETTAGTDTDTAKTEDTENTESSEASTSESKETDNSKDVELGTTEKGSYNNDYFGVSLKFPEAWEFQDAAGMNELTNASSEVIAGDDETKKKQIELSQAKTLNLLMASQYPLDGSQVGPSAMAIAEKVSLLQGIRTGKDYLKATKKFMEDSQFPYEYKEFTTETIGGKKMDLMQITMDAGNGSTITQDYYSTIIEGYAFNFIFTYLDDTTKAEIDNIKKSVQFK